MPAGQKRKYRSILIAGIPALAGIPVFYFTLVQAGLGSTSAIIWSALWCTLLAAGGLVLANMLRYYRPSGRATWMAGAWVLVAAFFSMLSGPLAVMFTGDPALADLLDQSVWLRWFIAVTLLGAVSLVSWVMKQAADQERNTAILAEADTLARKAELMNLRQQLQPHFLFNSLNSVYALIGSEPGKARKMIQQLGDFLRGTLRKEVQQLIPFSEELAHIRLYLDIEMVRFAHRLQVKYEISESSKGAGIPALLLQPLIENAIKFGVYGNEGDVLITLDARLTENMLSIQIANTRAAAHETPAKGTGFGLDSVKRRLFLLYGRNDLLSANRAEGMYVVNVNIPQPS